MEYDRIISSDTHVIEPPNLWTDRIDKGFRGRAPHVVAEEDGDWWYIDGLKTDSFGDSSQGGLRFEHMEEVTFAGRFADVRSGAYVPEDFLMDMDSDGVFGAVIYPTAGLTVYSVTDTGLLSAVCRAYNNWLSEFCQINSQRLKGVALINLDVISEAVDELRRASKIGLAGGMIPVSPPPNRPYDLPEYEPFWAAAQELEMPLSLHINTNRAAPGRQEYHIDLLKPSEYTVIDYYVRLCLSDMIYSGVFERYPKLVVGSVEHELAWALHYVNILDYTYTHRAPRHGWKRFKGDVLPSDFFRRNVFLSFQEDALGVKERSILGSDGLMWGSDYPHLETTFPRSRQILEEILAECTEEERVKIAGGNCARVYGV